MRGVETRPPRQSARENEGVGTSELAAGESSMADRASGDPPDLSPLITAVAGKTRDGTRISVPSAKGGMEPQMNADKRR